MKAYLNTFASAQGDCIFFRLVNGENKYVIMIDCGGFSKAIEEFVRDTLKKHIDLLVITHIDCDHINGVSEMLDKIPDITLGKIFYNCYQNFDSNLDIDMAETVKCNIDKLQLNLPQHVIKTDGGKINMAKASVLAEQIISNAQWKKVWEKEYIYNKTPRYSLGDGFGDLIFLAPRIDSLNELDKTFAREYLRLTTHKLPEKHFCGEETLYELVIKIVSIKNRDNEISKFKKVSQSHNKYCEDAWESARDFRPLSISHENSASIAFLWECNDKRVLFMGDAEPEIIKETLEEVYATKLPIDFEAIKIAHHGSKHSTSNGLMKLIDSMHYYITGGNKTDKPSLEALAKIVMRSCDNARTIHYNNKNNQMMIDLQEDRYRDLRMMYNFQISDSNEYEFEY